MINIEEEVFNDVATEVRAEFPTVYMVGFIQKHRQVYLTKTIVSLCMK